LLLVVREAGGEHFTPSDLELLAGVGERISTAVQLGLARQGQQLLARLEERQRIARDLHDTVIQDLIALGMRLDAELDGDEDEARRESHRQIVAGLDEVVHQLRESVFALGSRRTGEDLRSSLRRSMAEAARVLGFAPALRISGPVDEVGSTVGAEVQAVLREALSNIARHARAHSATVRIVVRGGRLTLTVDDDGIGVDAPGGSVRGRGNGLANIRERARDLGGETTVSPRVPTGTRLRWQVPLHGGGNGV
jgi:signal transduction histidine kinase